MPKTLKYSLIIFISIILLLIIIPFFIPLNNYKGVIIDKVKEATNRDLTINGDIKLSLLPNPAVSLSEIKLSSIDGTKEPHLISVEKAKASLKLFPLFRGAIEVSSIELQKPIINLEVLNNGQKNWQFVTPTSNNNPKINNVSSAESNNANTNGELELPILISHFKIIDGKVIYIEKNSEKIFNDINLDTKIKSLKGPIDFTLALKALEQQINIEGNIQEIGKIIPLSANINLASDKIKSEKIKIEGKFDSENNSFIGNANIKGNTKTLGMPADLQNDYELTTAITADNKNITIKDARLNYPNIELLANANYDIERNNLKSNIIINPGNIKTEISSNLDKTNIMLQADSLKPILDALKLKTDKLPPIINQKLNITSNVIYSSQAIKLQNINLIAANSNLTGDIELKNLAQDITISHNLKINNFESFMSLMGVSNLSKIGVLQLNGEVQKIKDTFHINNKISAFNTNISIKGDINLAAQKPNFNLNLYSPLVNLDKILATSNSPTTVPSKTSSPATQNMPTAKNNSPWSNNPINLGFLNEIEGQLSANIDKLTNDSLIINNLKAKLNITGGTLNITSVNASIYGGELSSTGYVSSGKDQNAAIKIDLKNAYLKSLTPQSGKIKITDGRLSFKTDLTSRGNSVYTYVNNLNGQFNVNSDNGKISGFDLNRIADSVNNAKNTEGVLRLINSSFSGGATSFKNLVAGGNITQGKLNLNECSLDATPAKANASGQINLPQYMMDISASVTIGELPPIAVKLYGFINNPQHKLDIQAFQTYLVKNVFNSVIKDLKSGEKKPENIIKDALGLRKKKDTNTEEQSSPPPENQQADPVNKLLQKGLKKLF